MHDERGVAVTAEYVALLGVSLLIFTAIVVGFGSFGTTAKADATAGAAYRVAALVGACASEMAESDASVAREVEIPERICGHGYIVYPSDGSRSVRVLVGRKAYEAPAILPGGVTVEGFLVSVTGPHRIVYKGASKTLTFI